jgi:hypothetical protein
MNTDAASRAAVTLTGNVDATRILRPGDDGYQDAAHVWNGAITSEPALIVRCETVSDVQLAVRAARETGLPISVKGGGHDWAGRSVRSGGLTVDLSGLRQVSVDPASRIATMGGGATAGDLIDETSRYGLAAATGTSAGVGVAGLLMGGGYGGAIGKYGLTLDSLISAQVVLADGRIVEADATTEPDLFWALRGGGGNFGVVTSLRMRLFPQETALGGFMMFGWDDAAKIWTGVERILADAPDELAVDTGMVSAPDGSLAVLVSPTWLGDQATGDEYIARFGGLGKVLASQVAPLPWRVLISFVDSMAPAGRNYALRTRSVAGFSDEVVETLVEAGNRRPAPSSNMPMHCFRGAAASVAPDATAFVPRRPHFMVEIIDSWTAGDPSQASHRRWVEETAEALSPHALPGGYVNLLGPDEAGRVTFGDNTARLLAAKHKYDPDNAFTAVPMPLP